MSDSVQMPALGESVTEGTVTRWLKQVGDPVAIDEPLLEVSTDKVDTEIPSPFAGTLLEILVSEDETVQVGEPLARIGSPDAAAAGTEAAGPGPEAVPAAAEAEREPVAGLEPEPAEPESELEPEPARQTEPEAEPAEPAEPAEQSEPEPEPAEPEPSAPSGDRPWDSATEDVRMPALGESVTEGTVNRWLKQVGDAVAVDEPLLEISTDKVDTEFPSPVAGTILELLAAEDETVAVGAPLARVGTTSTAQAGEAAATPAEPAGVAEAAPVTTAALRPEPVADAPPEASAHAQAPSRQTRAQVGAARPAAPTGGYLTPLVRKLAAEKAIDLSTITGTGVGGRIRKSDVLEAAERAEREAVEREQARADQGRAQPPAGPAAARSHRAAPAASAPSPLRGTTEKASRLRQIIASRMVESLQSMAQLTTVVEADVTRIARLRARTKDDFTAREGVNLSYLPFFVLAATEALKIHPKINGVLEGNQITYHGQENVGIAVDTDRGLVVPVIRDAGDLNLAGIARSIADLAARTRENRVTPDELSGATFTITNTGWAGAVLDTPIVPIGTSAILGTGAIVKRPVVATDEDGADYIVIRSMCYLSLSYDHRLVDGADASRYLATVKQRLEDGEFEADLGTT